MPAPTSGGNVVLDEHMDENYEPTQKEIEEYAEWLGMDLEADRELFWIAREGLKAPLPKPWKPCQSEDGEIFYFNFETGESVWDHPCDEHYRKMYHDKKKTGDDDTLRRKDKKEKKDKKDKKEKDPFDASASVDLPKPGESLYGVRTKTGSKLVFDCRPKAGGNSSTSPRSATTPNSLSPSKREGNMSDTERERTTGEKERLNELEASQVEKRRVRLQEFDAELVALQREHETKKRAKMRDLDADLVALERQHVIQKGVRRRELEKELEKDLKKVVEADVRDQLKPWAVTLEETMRKERTAEITQTMESMLDQIKLEKERQYEADVARLEDLHRDRVSKVETDHQERLEERNRSLEASLAAELTRMSQELQEQNELQLQKLRQKLEAEHEALQEELATEHARAIARLTEDHQESPKLDSKPVHDGDPGFAKLRDEAETLRRSNQNLQKQLDEARQEVSAVKDSTHRAEVQEAEARQQKEESDRRLTALQKEMSDLRQATGTDAKQLQELLSTAAENARKLSAAEIQKLTDQLAEQNAEVRRLQAELKSSQTCGQEPSAWKDGEASAKIVELQVQLEEQSNKTQRRVAELERAIVSKDGQLDQLEAEVAQSRKLKPAIPDAKQLQELLSTAAENARKLSATEVQKLKDQLAEQTAEVSRLQSELASSTQTGRGDGAMPVELGQLQTQLQQQSSKAQHRIAELERAIASKDGQLDQLEAQLTQARMLPDNSGHEHLAKVLAEREAEVRRLNPEVEVLTAQVRSMHHLEDRVSSLHAECQQQVKSHDAQLAAMQSMKDATANEAAAWHRRAESSEAELQRLQLEMSGERAQHFDSKSKEHLHAEQARAAEWQCEQLSAETEKLRARNGILEEQLRSEKQQLAQAISGMAEQERVRVDSAEVVRLRQELLSISSQLCSANQHSEEKLVALRTEMHEQVASYRSQLAALKLEKSSAASEVSSWQQRAEASESELHRVRTDMIDARGQQVTDFQREREAWLERERVLKTQLTERPDELRMMQSRLAHAEDDVRLHEDRCRRLSALVEGAARQNDEKMLSLQSELQRTDKDLHEAALKLRAEARKRDEVANEYEEELRTARRQLTQKEVEISDLHAAQAARMKQDEVAHAIERREAAEREAASGQKERLLEQRESLLRAAERMLRKRELEVEAEADQLAQEAKRAAGLQLLGIPAASLTAPAGILTTADSHGPGGAEHRALDESQVTRRPSDATTLGVRADAASANISPRDTVRLEGDATGGSPPQDPKASKIGVVHQAPPAGGVPSIADLHLLANLKSAAGLDPDLGLAGDTIDPATLDDFLLAAKGRAKRLREAQLQATLGGLRLLEGKVIEPQQRLHVSRPRSARTSKEGLWDQGIDLHDLLLEHGSYRRSGAHTARGIALHSTGRRRVGRSPRSTGEVLAGQAAWLRDFERNMAV